jgi:hypothetical protein
MGEIKMCVRKLTLLLMLPIVAFATGKSSNEKIVLAYKLININITLDGKLTEPIWQREPIKEFVQKDPNEGTPSSEQTNVWVAFDNDYIYVAAKLYDSKPELIDASIARRDNYFSSDWFAFYVDPYNDKKLVTSSALTPAELCWTVFSLTIAGTIGRGMEYGKLKQPLRVMGGQ